MTWSGACLLSTETTRWSDAVVGKVLGFVPCRCIALYGPFRSNHAIDRSSNENLQLDNGAVRVLFRVSVCVCVCWSVFSPFKNLKPYGGEQRGSRGFIKRTASSSIFNRFCKSFLFRSRKRSESRHEANKSTRS